jgi:hypothetical protein
MGRPRPVIPGPRRLSQEDQELEAILGYKKKGKKEMLQHGWTLRDVSEIRGPQRDR